jgi:predicted dehydrogenase
MSQVRPEAPVRIGQFGTRHGHAAGKWRALCTNSDVEAVGIWDAQALGPERFSDARWFASANELLEHVDAVAIEGRNHESLAMADLALRAGKHLWFDKPAGDDWAAFQSLMDRAEERNLYVQMGYMFRYSLGFQTVAEYARSGALGDIFGVRAHMSTSIDLAERTEQSRHLGGILYDLGGHMLDQIVWLLGRPTHVSSVLRNDATPTLPTYSDNTLAVLHYDRALALVDIAAMEVAPTARRFEVYGTRGSAILEPFDAPRAVRLTLEDERVLEIPKIPRQELYERELQAFVRVLRQQAPAHRSIAHERLVQETLLRATGRLST